MERARPPAGLVPPLPRGTLLAPTARRAGARWGPRPSAPAVQPDPRTPPRCRRATAGSRSGRAPRRRPRRGRRPLGPTPRYAETPSWGLADHFDGPERLRPRRPRSGPFGSAMVRATLVVNDGRAWLRRSGARRAIRAAADQPITLLNRGGLDRDLGWASRRVRCGVHDRGQRRGADQLADCAAGRGRSHTTGATIRARPGRCGRVALCRW